MIIKASQRSNGGELASHLLNTKDNEHVEVHRIQGFVSDSLGGALQEAHALSRGTRCSQYLFSVSFNPPKGKTASIADFEDAIARFAQKNGLSDQPHVIVFHEKEGRRHAHCVWSRIDAQSMTAINLPFFKNRAVELSKELYLEHGWALPQGFVDKEQRNPLNFTLAQWQQAKRLNDDPKAIKLAIKECWAVSDDRASFESGLERQGYYLARGDRRGFVAVDWRGEVYSLSRWLDMKTKDLQTRLGGAEALPSVEEAQNRLDQTLSQRMQDFARGVHDLHAPRFARLSEHKSLITIRHEQERADLGAQQDKRQEMENQERMARLRHGLLGLWDRVTGKQARIQKHNEIEALQGFRRDRMEKDALIFRQLEERQNLQERIEREKETYAQDMQRIREAVFSKLPEDKIRRIQPVFDRDIQPPFNPNLEMEI